MKTLEELVVEMLETYSNDDWEVILTHLPRAKGFVIVCLAEELGA